MEVALNGSINFPYDKQILEILCTVLNDSKHFSLNLIAFSKTNTKKSLIYFFFFFCQIWLNVYSFILSWLNINLNIYRGKVKATSAYL